MFALDTRTGQKRVMSSVMIQVLLLVPAIPALGASLTWNGTTGNAATTTKWSPQQLPTGSDDLFFPGATTFTITFDGSVTSSLSHTYRNTVATTLSVSSPHTVGGTFDIGTFSGDNPTVHLGSGALSVTGNVALADVNGSSGTMSIDGSDATLTVTGASSDFIAGRSGPGTVSITGGGFIEVGDDFQLGSLANGSGDVTVNGGTGAFPALLRSHIETTGANGDVIVGNLGNGTLSIEAGGFVHSGHDVKIALSSGHTGSVDLSGTISFFGSSLNVDNNLDISRNDAATATGTGTLTLNTSTTAFVDGSTRIGDPNGGTGTLVLAGGILNSTGVIDVQTNGNITGTGTILGNIDNLGDITPTGVNGLTLEGVLSNTTSNRIIGTKIDFSGTGGYEGSGTCNAAITGDATSHITATGTLSIGNNTTAGFSYLGTLDVGGSIVTLVDSNGAVLGGLTTMNSGRIECPVGVGVQNGGRLQGDGLVIGTVTNAGTLDPHTSGNLGGLITVQGNLLMNPSGIFDMEIGGAPASNNNDRSNVSGTATFGGTMRVKLKNGYIPHVGEQFIAINATSGRIGEFDDIILDPSAANVCNDVTFVLVYSSTASIVLVRPPLGCTALGDLNSNGGCDGTDIAIFMDSLLHGPYNSCSDMNGDCTNNIEDVAIFVNCLL
jgi:hypothetical protein